jgi:hypothetical protein
MGPSTGCFQEGNGRVTFLRKIKFHVATLIEEFKSAAVILVVHKFKNDTDFVFYTRQREVFRCFVKTAVIYKTQMLFHEA